VAIGEAETDHAAAQGDVGVASVLVVINSLRLLNVTQLVPEQVGS
jgi:hypothetical protein